MYMYMDIHVQCTCVCSTCTCTCIDLCALLHMLRLNAWARCDWRCPPGWHHHEDEGVDRVLWEPETQGQGPQCHQPGVLGNRVSAIVHVMYMLLHACDMLLYACDMNVNTEWNDLVLHVSGNIYAWMLTVIHELVFILCKMIKFFACENCWFDIIHGTHSMRTKV